MIGHDREDDNADTYNDRLRRRMLMARIEAGYGDKIEDLRDRLHELGYVKGWSTGTLRAMESGRHSGGQLRNIDKGEVRALAEACRVAAAFFYLDFAQLEEPNLRAEVAELDARVSGGFAQIGGELARLEQLLQEHRETGHPAAPPGDAPQ